MIPSELVLTSVHYMQEHQGQWAALLKHCLSSIIFLQGYSENKVTSKCLKKQKLKSKPALLC